MPLLRTRAIIRLVGKGTKNGIFIGIEESDYPLTESSAITSVHGGTAPARIGYFLDTKGPLLALSTACSSSLVAVHYACKSILNGESDYALAGGCNITSNPGRMLFGLSQMGDMLSPDGTCYAFDQRGQRHGYWRRDWACCFKTTLRSAS